MPGVLVFDRDGDLSVFPSIAAAEGYLEVIDVRDGEYPAAFLHDGTVLKPAVRDDTVVLQVAAQRDLDALADWLGQYRQRNPSAFSKADPLRFANEWLQQEWRARWPRRPAWLSRRLHGAGPKQVTDEL